MKTKHEKIRIALNKYKKASKGSMTELSWTNEILRLSEIDQLEPEGEACANCKETVNPCACLRNICMRCGKPVGNITFTVCDECWDKEHPLPQQPSDSAGEGVWVKSDKDYGLCIYDKYEKVMGDNVKKLTRPTVSEEDRLIGYVDYISALISYTALLGNELDETAIIAHAHGWRTTREAEGLSAREILNKLSKSLLLPTYTEVIKELNR